MTERTMQERAREICDMMTAGVKHSTGRCGYCDAIMEALEEVAAAARDDGKRALSWTREKPTEPGWYWVKLDVPDGKIQVRYFRGSWDAVYYVPVLFAGPIPEPEQAKP